jgi:putative ABC transport system ATP-binding protein
MNDRLDNSGKPDAGPPPISANRVETATVDTPIVDISDLLFRWRAELAPVLALDELSVRAGERVFIKGASGSGKSTLLSLIGGIVTPERGKVRVLGHDLTSMNSRRRDAYRADHLGFVFQMFNLIPYLSVLENVTLPCRFSVRRRSQIGGSDDALQDEAVRLLSHLDIGEPDMLQRPVTELSVGQQQRVAAARALIGRPELVIADEPTSALDFDRRESFLRLLESECEAQGSTLIFVSHDSSLEPLFDLVLDLTTVNRARSHHAASRHSSTQCVASATV